VQNENKLSDSQTSDLDFVVTSEDATLRMLALMSLSEGHARLSIRSCAQYVIPAVVNECYRLVRYKGRICGYVIFASVNDQLHSELLLGKFPIIKNEQWNEGENFWILDLIMPSTASNERAFWDFLNLVRTRICKNEEMFLHLPGAIASPQKLSEMPANVSMLNDHESQTSGTVLLIRPGK
jgi:hemolysin-activating ACP:hemolysin acyltransferase